MNNQDKLNRLLAKYPRTTEAIAVVGDTVCRIADHVCSDGSMEDEYVSSQIQYLERVLDSYLRSV